MKNNNAYYKFKYNNCKRVLSVLYSCFQIAVCVAAVLFLPWYIAILFVIVSPIIIYLALELLFFEVFIISKTYVIRKSYLFKLKRIDIKSLKVDTVKYLFTGMIRFRQKGKIPIYIEVFPIGTIGWLKIRNILVRKNVINKENDLRWNF